MRDAETLPFRSDLRQLASFTQAQARQSDIWWGIAKSYADRVRSSVPASDTDTIRVIEDQEHRWWWQQMTTILTQDQIDQALQIARGSHY